MHWTLRVLVATACLASLTWAGQLRGNKGNKVESQANVEQDEVLAIDPEERIITVGNADSTKHAVAGSIVLTGVWIGAMLIIAELIKGIGTRIYPLEGSQGDEQILISVRSASASTGLLERALAGIDSVNSRMASEERAVCRKMSLCQMGNMTSGFRYVHTFLEILRPVFPQIDDNWEGLLAGEAREDCNILYPECPGAILRAMFAEVY
ncbi:uncharacterized protein LOC123508589 isoform X1 [Portunus trituberculatus]|uniref:uncharacterized protein LOC123508589 isoform X1 n=1 Tax=Portunus trituberculatus TaxID=210409 RepID=UPI001E1CD287|nr:uncharacterized protein LOC123508589 isoform X1 [Portunus trituberculatus]XP_045118298.1 uncharacterized protein LOC123508589 isoform X1 [Portunus trituberculatus]